MSSKYLAMIESPAEVVPAVSAAPAPPCDEPGEVERMAQLDAERNEADRQAGRGYDYDSSAPSHAEFVQRQALRNEAERRALEQRQIAEHRERVAETEVRLDRLAVPQSADCSAAMSLIRTCKEYGVSLRLDGRDLVIVSNGKAWRSLVNAIEAHVDAISDLIVAGWDGTDA